MSVHLYRSTDTGATALTGQNNSLIAVLLACLVNGYNSQTVTSITRSGSTATVTKTGHGYNDRQRIVHSGANETEYNIEAAITVVDANTYTYQVSGTPATPATGTITAKVAGAGWTQPFTGTNKAVFRNSPTTGTGFYLNIQDNGPGAGAAKEARIWGYEVATAQDAGTGQFPTTAQMTNGLFIRKSNTADATARPWVIVADDTVFYMFVETGDFTTPARTFAWMFGDFFSYKASDAYRCMIIGRTTENSAIEAPERFPVLVFGATANTFNNTVTGHYIARNATGTGGSLECGKAAGAPSVYSVNGGESGLGSPYSQSNQLSYPNPADNGLYMGPCFLNHGNGLRGYLKGLWAPWPSTPLGHGDIFSGAGTMAGKTFLAQNGVYRGVTSTNWTSQCFMEISNTWS